jgi:hypothetical protein
MLLLCGLAVELAVPGAPVQGAEPSAGVTRFSIPLTRELGEVLPLDLERRGRKDLVVIEIDRARRDASPYLEVFRQSEKGFAAIPSAAHDLPAEVTLVGAGQFRQGAGLVLLTPEAVEVRIWRGGQFRPLPGLRLELESLFPKSDGEPRDGLNWIADLNGDGFAELIVPRLDGFTVVTQNAEGALVPHAVLRTRPKGEILRWYRRNRVAYDLPAAAYIPMNRSAWKSVVAYGDGLLSVFHLQAEPSAEVRRPDVEADLQPRVPFDPKAPWDPPLLLVQADDLNADGWLDLVFSKASSGENDLNAKTRILVYYGRGDAQGNLTFSREPDQVFALEGFTLPILLDLNGDRALDLVLVNVEFTFWTAIKALIARSVSADAAFYRMRHRAQYPLQPDDQSTFAVKFSLGRFSHQPISVFGDLNGDGLPDLLLSAASDTLGIHWGRKDQFWKATPDASIKDFFPISANRVLVTDLDGDGRDDLLMGYVREDIRKMPDVNHTFTVLLSRFAPLGQTSADRTP